MKKTTSFVFLLLAAGALLAHSAIPHHHHHNAAVCLANDHCLDSEGHNDDAEHQNNGDTEECFIKKTFTVSVKREHSQTCACCFVPPTPLLAYFNPKPGIRDDDGMPFRQRPFIETYHYEYLTRSLGLRAPPVC